MKIEDANRIIEKIVKAQAAIVEGGKTMDQAAKIIAERIKELGGNTAMDIPRGELPLFVRFLDNKINPEFVHGDPLECLKYPSSALYYSQHINITPIIHTRDP